MNSDLRRYLAPNEGSIENNATTTHLKHIEIATQHESLSSSRTTTVIPERSGGIALAAAFSRRSYTPCCIGDSPIALRSIRE